MLQQLHTHVTMIQSTKNTFEIKIPADYKYRYTLRFLINLKSISDSRGKNDITNELAGLLDLGVEMLKKYIGETDEQREELSLERRQVMATYFGLDDPDLIITQKYQ